MFEEKRELASLASVPFAPVLVGENVSILLVYCSICKSQSSVARKDKKNGLLALYINL